MGAITQEEFEKKKQELLGLQLVLDKLDISESDWAKMLAFERGMC